MSDEIRAEDEVEAHVFAEGGTIESGTVEGTLEATEDDDADVEAHGVVEGVVENAKGVVENAK